MGEVLAAPAVLVVLVTAAAVVAAKVLGAGGREITASPTLALQSGDTWYRQAAHMARLLDRLRNDPMVACTIDAPVLDEMQKVTERFWSDVAE